MREFELRFAPWTTSSRNGGVATFQGQNGGGTLVLASQGSGSLSSWCSAIACASVGSCSGASQAKSGRRWCGGVGVRGELKSGAFGENRGDQVAGFGSSRKGATWRAEEDRVLVSRGVCCSWRRGDRIAREVCVRARRIRRRSGVCALLCLQMAMYILCKLLSRVQLYQESANIQAVRAAGAFLCNFVSVHCSSSTSVRRECE